MNKEIIERWMSFSAKNEKDAFSKVILFFPETENKLFDIRGFPFGRDETRNDLRNYTFKNADFSFSHFKNCNMFGMKFAGCTFIDCDFSELRLWNTEFENCVFIRSNYKNATMGKDCIYKNCRFEACKLTGKYFSFGIILHLIPAILYTVIFKALRFYLLYSRNAYLKVSLFP